MLVWLASYPRSGNTFFRLALHQLYGRRSVGMQARGVKPPGDDGRPYELRTELTDAEMAESEAVYFVKTHSLPSETTNPAIYLVRDGRDSLVSYAWFSLVWHRGMAAEQVTPEQIHEALFNVMVDPRGPYGTWGSNVLAWLSRPHTCVLKFEDMIRTPEKSVSEAMHTLSLLGDYRGGRIPAFAELHAARPDFYRRGDVGSWRDEFPSDLLDQFWCIHGEAMDAVGYSRNRHFLERSDRSRG